MNTLRQILSSKNAVGILRKLAAAGTLRELEPTLANLDMDIPAGYRHKDVLLHSITVLENAIEREPGGVDLVLRAAALFHDIGKPATRKLEGKNKVTFNGHEVIGARIVRKALPAHGFSQSEVKDIASLVAAHMRSHGNKNWSDSAVRRLANDAGSDTQLNRLLIIFYADATTANKVKKERHVASIDRLVAEIQRVREVDERNKRRPALNGHEVMDLLNLEPGRTLGQVMKFLNSEEGLLLSREDAILAVQEEFGHE